MLLGCRSAPPCNRGATFTRPDDSQDTRMVEPSQPKFTIEPEKTPPATPSWHCGRSILSSLRVGSESSHFFCRKYQFLGFHSLNQTAVWAGFRTSDIHLNTFGRSWEMAANWMMR
jgi:hypothetical protein